MGFQRCTECGQDIVGNALFCPYCLSSRVDIDESWMAYTTSGSDNPIANHDLVPEHRLYPDQKVEALLEEYAINRTDLPQIKASDPAIQHLSCSAGDIIEIIRDSRTTDTARNYRMVVNGDGSLEGSESAAKTWRNPAEPADGTYERPSELTEEQALHVLDNLRAHIPPSRPGTCETIAVDRVDEITTAVNRVKTAEPYTFIQGELGYGKSFFLHWVRDRVFPTCAVSFIDLDTSLTFKNTDEIIDEICTQLETPRSIAHDTYANGLDELWDTCLRQLADLCAGHIEGQGYQLEESLVAESLQTAVKSILEDTNLSASVISALTTLAESYFDSHPQSLSRYLETEDELDNKFELLELLVTLGQFNGYRILIGVDELEKSDRSKEHFKAIEEFVSALPEGASLFVTGTPELVKGGKDGNALKGTYSPLYDRTTSNRIALDPPTETDLQEFTEQLLDLEKKAVESPVDREYQSAIENRGGIRPAIDSFLSEQSPSFRAYLDYLESKN